MATDIVKDYLGHPCQIAEAFSRFADPVKDAREIAAKDPRSLYRQIGIALVEVHERMQHIEPVLTAALNMLPNNTDDDECRAVLEMAREYICKTDDAVWGMGGLALAGLEHAGAIKAQGGAAP